MQRSDTEGLTGDEATLAADDAPAPVPTQEATPERIGRFVVSGTLGHGGMGTVLEAYDERLDRAIALKLLHPGTESRHAERLEREAKALARLSHPHVVQVYEVGEIDGRMFIAMELVRGQTLRAWQQARPSWRECVAVYMQAGRGLAAAHAAGLVHRDFKPHNCIIDEEGRVRVLDFGLARDVDVTAMGPHTLETEPVSAAEVVGSLTRTGAVLGTLAYMPLEQLGGAQADERSDQFSFCVALYEALYGERPFPGDTVGSLAAALTDGAVSPPPKGSRVPAPLRKVLLRGLSVDPDARWPSMDALLDELDRIVAPSRTGWIVAGVSGTTLAVTLLMAVGSESEPPCRGAEARLDGVWDDAAREEVRAALLGTEVAYAADTLERVEAHLDAYASAWAVAHTDACEATAVRKEQSAETMDLRIACLSTRRIALREKVEVLRHASPRVVERAVDMVTSLPDLARCEDVEALRAEVPPPDDPAVAEQVEQMRGRVARISALLAVADLETCLKESEALVEDARATGYGPILSSATLARGACYDTAGRYDEARQDYEQSFLLALEHGDDAAASVSARTMAHFLGEQSSFELALARGRTALALARRPHAAPKELANALHTLGSIQNSNDQYDDGLANLRAALALKEQLLPPEHPEIARTLNNIGLGLSSQGKIDESLEVLQRSLEIKSAALGPDHPNVASTLSNLGSVLLAKGNWKKAEETLQRSLDIHIATLGPDHPTVGGVLIGLGGAQWKQGELDEAEQSLSRAVVLLEKGYGRDHTMVAGALTNLGGLLRIRGDLDGAAARLERALQIHAVNNPEHTEAATALTSLGKVEELRGDSERAVELLGRALELRAKTFGEDSPVTASSHFSLGEVLRLAGRLDEAAAELRRAEAGFRSSIGPDSVYRPQVLHGLASIALEQGERAQARAQLEEALTLLQASDEAAPEALAQVRALLARALEDDPQARIRARALATQAERTYAEQGDEQSRARVQQWLREHP